MKMQKVTKSQDNHEEDNKTGGFIHPDNKIYYKLRHYSFQAKME